MRQEDKELLLRDLSGRLPYGVKLKIGEHSDYKLIGIIITDEFPIKVEVIENDIPYRIEVSLDMVKPYLRPMSSMTEEEKVQLSQYACIGEDLNGEFIDEVQRKDCAAYIDWLNANYFDYRGLIEKGLAVAVTENPYKK